MIHSTILVAAMLPVTIGWAIGEEQRDAAPELTMAVARQALAGWELYQAGNYSGTFQEGRYTDTNADVEGYDFWSDGRYAKLDRAGDGHHETIFLIRDGELVYVGTLNKKGDFGHTARAYRRFRNQSVKAFRRSLP